MSSNKEVTGGTSGSVQSEKAIKTLSNTFTTLYEGDLKELNEKLDQFSGRQEQLRKDIQTEKDFFVRDENWKDAQELMANIQTYKDKLIAIKREMGNIHSRTRNLKKKAADIQELKMKQLN